MLYILENGKKAYIGESNHVKTRMTQHTTNEEKRIFNKVHFIYSRLFNQSVTFDYESKLIQYIVADELFQVTNKNSGIADKQYLLFLKSPSIILNMVFLLLVCMPFSPWPPLRGGCRRSGWGREPCHYPKYFGLRQGSTPPPLRGTSPARGGKKPGYIPIKSNCSNETSTS